MRLIDADELRKKIVARVVHGEDKIDRGFNLGIGAALDLLNVAPTVEERLKGNWVEMPSSIPGCVLLRCPFCHAPESYKASFCINCGADLRGEGKT